jgi:hypothetical protein
MFCAEPNQHLGFYREVYLPRFFLRRLPFKASNKLGYALPFSLAF